MEPSVSILLPVYNGAEYVFEAIESILAQTFSDFEVVIIDDGSSDESAAIIRTFSDHRIRFYAQQNMGLAPTLNRAIRLARGSYIARHDQDDISARDRLEKQVGFLQAHPEIGMVGTWASIMCGSRRTRRTHKHPSSNQALQFELLFDNPFVHSSVMVRKSVFDRVGLYTTDSTRQPPEDYELWSRVARDFEVANIPEFLVMYREVPGSMSRQGKSPFLTKLLVISSENLTWRLGEPMPTDDIKDVAALYHRAFDDLPLGARIENMLAIIKRAAFAIGGEAPDPQLLRALASKRWGLKFRFLLFRMDGRALRCVTKFVVRLKRRIGTRR